MSSLVITIADADTFRPGCARRPLPLRSWSIILIALYLRRQQCLCGDRRYHTSSCRAGSCQVGRFGIIIHTASLPCELLSLPCYYLRHATISLKVSLHDCHGLALEAPARCSLPSFHPLLASACLVSGLTPSVLRALGFHFHSSLHLDIASGHALPNIVISDR